MEVECPICSESAHIVYSQGARMDVSCERCGKYCIGIPIASSRELAKHKKRHILAGAIRNLSEQGVKVEISTLEDIETILDSVSEPSDPLEAIDLLLKYLYRKASKADEYVYLNLVLDYPILFAKDADEFQYCLQKALELKYIERAGDGYRPDTEGWRRLIELRKEERESDQAFVAMWFDPSLDEVWENGFKLALKETGYNPIRVDLTEHNEKICDRIIAEIRKSGLVIADFTGQRGGVYFEAGFAMGLGTPVIWTCRDTDVEKLHFDTRQYNHIVWSDSADLKKKLVNRIEATLPIRPRKGQ
jgi:nucleoside 2-deoxyribosyltransferase